MDAHIGAKELDLQYMKVLELESLSLCWLLCVWAHDVFFLIIFVSRLFNLNNALYNLNFIMKLFMKSWSIPPSFFFAGCETWSMCSSYKRNTNWGRDAFSKPWCFLSNGSDWKLSKSSKPKCRAYFWSLCSWCCYQQGYSWTGRTVFHDLLTVFMFGNVCLLELLSSFPLLFVSCLTTCDYHSSDIAAHKPNKISYAGIYIL